ncbi:MAG: hypothetical protein HC811_12775 [Flammeovirgaceae bacterium]|nr:hypothetical protein [Flammeovirgaceae bacterium]
MTKSAKQNLVVIYFSVTMLVGISVTLLHYVLVQFNLAPSSLLMYLPLLVIVEVVVFYAYFREKVKAVGFRGAGVTTVPTVYFMAMLAAPFLPLNAISLLTDRVIEVNTVDELRDTNEMFIHISDVKALPEQLIDTVMFETSEDDDGNVNTQFNYLALVPLVSGRDTWLVVRNFEAINRYETLPALLDIQSTFWQASREEVLRFPYDSIEYLEKIDRKEPLAFLLTKGVNPVDPVFIHGSLSSISEFRIILCWIMGGTYLVLSLFFIMTVATGHNERL